MDSQVIDRIKKQVGTGTKATGKLIHGISFDPHPTRSKVIMGSKVGIAAFFGGLLAGIGWMRRGRSS